MEMLPHRSRSAAYKSAAEEEQTHRTLTRTLHDYCSAHQGTIQRLPIAFSLIWKSMATGLTLPSFTADLSPSLSSRPMLSPSVSTPLDNPSPQSLSPNSARSPWIRLFKLFQSKNRQELDKAKNGVLKATENECARKTSPRRREGRDEDTKAKRNIYRRPNSRSGYSQRLSASSMMDGGRARSPGRRKSDPVNNEPKKHEPSLEETEAMMTYHRQRSSSVPAVYHSQGFRSRMEKARLDGIRKQTTFQEDINIVYYEDDELDDRLNGTEGIAVNEGSISDDAGPQTPEKCRSSASLDAIDYECVRPGDIKSIDIPPHFTLGKTRKGLRIMIEIDEGCVRRKTCVRAMSGGKTLVVLTYKPVSDGHLAEHKDVINLPVNIDPFCVKANVLKSGHLCIQAPLRKESI